MSSRYGLLLPIALLALTAGCAPAPTADTAGTHDSDVQALRDTEAQMARDMPSKNVDKLTGYYADDATLMMPNAPPASGKQPIRTAFQSLMTDPNVALDVHATRVEVGKGGDLGFTQGTYTMTMTDPKTKKPVNDKGKYLTTWKKQADGSWKIVADMINSDLPASQ